MTGSPIDPVAARLTVPDVTTLLTLMLSGLAAALVRLPMVTSALPSESRKSTVTLSPAPALRVSEEAGWPCI